MAIELDYIFSQLVDLDEEGFLLRLELETERVTDTRIDYIITYGQEEYSRIRERFSAPEGSTFKSIIEDTLSGIINELDLTIAGRVSGKKVLAPKQFTRNDFFAISGVEGTQDVAVSLSTVTGSAGVTSTSVYSAGSGY